uniref:Uncharacterized protein n=1 Tax=Arundo donax TaxID=35708 RepID=A0A0A9B385_ARUDO
MLPYVGLCLLIFSSSMPIVL